MDPEELPQTEETLEESEDIEEGEKPEANEPKLARVEYDYEAHDSDELSFNKGDIITVLEQGSGGWWKGDLNGKIGLFPENHVKLIEVPSQSAEDDEDTKSAEGKRKKTLNKYGVKQGGIGSLFAEGRIPSLRKRSSESSSVSEEKNATASAPSLKKTSVPSPVNQQPSIPQLPPKKKPPKPKKVEPKAEVMFEYEAAGDDEISLTQGTYVIILDKSDEDGWWSGKNEQGQVGLFPSSYVKEINPTEESQPVSEEVNESSEAPATAAQEEVLTPEPTPEPTPASADSPPSSIHSSSHDTYEVHNDDSPTLPKSPPARRTTNEASSPTTPNRRSTYESSQAASPKRRSTSESTSRRNSSHDGEEHVTSRRPPSLVSPDLPPIQSISTNLSRIDTSPTSPEERPMAPPRQLSRSDSQKSPTLAKPPGVPKSFSPAKPPVPPIRKSSSKSDKVTSPTEPISPKTNRRASHDHDSSTALSEPDDKEDKEDKEDIEDDEQTDEVLEKREETYKDKEAEISEEEVVGDDDKDVPETPEAKDEEDIVSGHEVHEVHEVEPEEKKSQPQLPPLPSGPKLTSLGKDRPVIKNRKVPSVKSVKETASQSQTAALLEAVASEKDEVEQKPTSPTPPKPEKPIKPNSFKLPILGTGVQLRSIPKKPPIETSTEPTETTKSSTTPSGIDTRPTGGVKGLSSRFQGIPNSSSDVEFRLKKFFNEEINKLKSHFEAQLAEERSKREALEETLQELIESLQN